MMKKLFMVTAVIEVGAGLALLCCASLTAALLSLAVACWLARNDERSRAAKGLVAAMCLYNTGTVALLAFAGIGPRLVGIALWPAVALHAALAVWCLVCLRRARS